MLNWKIVSYSKGEINSVIRSIDKTIFTVPMNVTNAILNLNEFPLAASV